MGRSGPGDEGLSSTQVRGNPANGCHVALIVIMRRFAHVAVAYRFVLTLCCGGHYAGSRRARRSSDPARPYIVRFSVLR